MIWQKMKKISSPKRLEVDRDSVKALYKKMKKIMKANGVKTKGFTMASCKREMQLQNQEEIWSNGAYEVSVNREDDIVHLSLKNYQRTTDIPWQHKQWIKNDIMGEEYEACELFPAESRLVNTANQYHLWCFPKGYMKFGWNQRFTSNETPTSQLGTGKQDLQER